ncbi:GATA zinc finger domain-containing protein 10-like isoform X2 [Cucumis melo var. makuwa]|uniref:GATA zinc finger domain-containing protein 10-like isoform X2 n=1 Tax=Cucumis melo var. makuwa TaxID=1194695 RepID=A0A5D3C9Q5_CUCMM|nr:GATA zinc finger domain-containing protein 10-like isoform X2 [Cucumis melo var. makuwa]TYK08613.1 GATA zinc finger domain-containing protein 10-like isoform X2 [Cucumis melo var. makuwa]
MTQTQSQIGYGSLMMMMSTFGSGYCDPKVSIRYYDSGINPSSSYIDADSTTSYMHGHEHGHREHNEYLYYEALRRYQIDKSTNNNQRTKRSQNNIEFRVDSSKLRLSSKLCSWWCACLCVLSNLFWKKVSV